MIQRLSTPNILEISYLLARHHQIVDVATQTSWPYGINELSVTLEGDGLELDHGNFLRHGVITLSEVPKAFEAVQNILWQKIEGGLV